VNRVYGADVTPMDNIKVYLFKGSGAYLGVNNVTDDHGQVTFNLPLEAYKVRADYLSAQYWSDPFIWVDQYVEIEHGFVDIHATFNGQDVNDAPVYLFSDRGSYLGKFDRTDTMGRATFLIPEGSYKFRVDYNNSRYWSDVINVIPHEENGIDLALEQLALNLTNDPNPDRIEGVIPIYKHEGIRVASIGSLVGILSQTMVANTPSPAVYYYHNDHLGIPQLMTNENGVVVWEADYYPFGEANIQMQGGVVNNFRFPGQYYDNETGLHFNYHRFYDPITGRYLTPDPIGQLGGIYLYTYAVNNPVNYIDPFGLTTIMITIDRNLVTTNSTIGDLTVNLNTKGYTLELPWSNNARNNSRIPAGVYFGRVKEAKDTKFNYDVIEILDVLGRSDILMHRGNEPDDTEGCILPGETKSTDFVGNSKKMLNTIMDLINTTQAWDRMVGEQTEIIIKVTDPN
jgi:RHS repeat-associated protein